MTSPKIDLPERLRASLAGRYAGKQDLALDQLEPLLQVPFYVSRGWLRPSICCERSRASSIWSKGTETPP